MDIQRTFTYNKPFGDQPQRYENIRNHARAMAEVIDSHCPDSREKSIALTNLQQTVMWANAAIAINEEELD